ncbi:MAG: ABC transporter ATP-binding protein [Anaerolineae bacterium]|nr:ABC transporter ATP-binding protein [Anaerolineae bacterium]
MKQEPLIQLKRVVKRYEGLAGAVVALRELDLQVGQGEFLVVTGKSGAGKTTLVNMIAGLDRCTSGEIWVDGTPVHRLGIECAARWRGRTVGVVFQTFELLPTLSVLQNVTLPMDFAAYPGGRAYSDGGRRYSIRQRRARAMALLEQLEIADHAHKPPSGVSGGQQQRVAIARALANDPPILLADEPTGSLDTATASAVLQVFESLADQGKTVVLVTHDEDIARRATRTVTLADGEIVRQTVPIRPDFAPA